MNTTPNDTSDTFDHDAQLTAFALGELSGDEAAALAARIDRDDDLGREVEEIRRTSALVAASLADETVVGLTPEQRAAIIDSGEDRDGTNDPADDRERGVLFSFASMRTVWGGLGLAAAACLAIVFIWPGVVAPRDPSTVAIDLSTALSEEEPAADTASIGDRKDVLAKQALASSADGPAPTPELVGGRVGVLKESLGQDVVTSLNATLSRASGQRAEHEEQAASGAGDAVGGGFVGGEGRVRDVVADRSLVFEDQMKNEKADDQEFNEFDQYVTRFGSAVDSDPAREYEPVPQRSMPPASSIVADGDETESDGAALPSGTKPHRRLSELSSELSPMAKKCSSGIVSWEPRLRRSM